MMKPAQGQGQRGKREEEARARRTLPLELLGDDLEDAADTVRITVVVTNGANGTNRAAASNVFEGRLKLRASNLRGEGRGVSLSLRDWGEASEKHAHCRRRR